MNPDTNRDEQGFTILEAVIAAALMALSIASIALVITDSVRSVAASQARAEAVRLSDSIIENAYAFGCGLTIGDNLDPVARQSCPAANVGDADLLYLPDNPDNVGDWVDITESPLQIEGATEDKYVAGPSPVNGVAYEVTLRSAWTQVNPTAPNACGIDPTEKPDGLSRYVEARWNSWERRIETHTITDTFEGIPSEAAAYNDTSRGSVMVITAPGNHVWATITVNNEGVPENQETLLRIADENGCAWFPFIPVGGAVTVNGSSRTVNAPGQYLEMAL